MRKFSVVVVLVSFCCFPAHGETVDEATNRYFEVMKRADYSAAADLYDPAELKSFRSSLDFLVSLPNASKEQLYDSFFGPGSTQEAVDNLTDQEFFASFYAAAMAQASMDQIMSTAKTEYLGHVMEGDNVAHAVTRISVDLPELSFENLSVASFVQRGNSWKMKMTGDVRGVADRIRQAVEM